MEDDDSKVCLAKAPIPNYVNREDDETLLRLAISFDSSERSKSTRYV